MQGSETQMRSGVWELRVPTCKRREPTEAAQAKAAAEGRKAFGTPIMVKATFSGTWQEADAELRRARTLSDRFLTAGWLTVSR